MSVKIMTGLVLLAGLINFLPVLGLLSVERMQALYAVDLRDPNLAILMRHRALLFGLVGGFMMWAAFQHQLLPAAFVMGFVSMLGFMVLAWQSGGYNAAIHKLVVIDALASIALAVALVLYLVDRSLS